MRATRRNVLVILGVLTIAGGALFGTGAFTTAEADRSVSIETADDSDAVIGLEAGNSEWVTSEDGQLTIDANKLNRNATFDIEPAFTVENNYGEDISNVNISVTTSGDAPSITANTSDFNLPATESQAVALKINTDDLSSDSYDVTLTVEADT
mgnify:CR=1 FL=1